MANIYLIQPTADGSEPATRGKLVPMREEPYDSEDLLQELLANYPELLAGDASDGDTRWALVRREASVPAELGGGGWWSLDHLFLDSRGIPTLVEVKRSTDTRIRREVVGQMLDYAANGVAYWPVDDLRRQFEETCRDNGSDAEAELRRLLDAEAGEDPDVDAFWSTVATNLRAGRVRLVFVADSLPKELIRIIEFLNEQMDPAIVLGIVVQQFVGEGLRTLVPKLVGQTQEAVQKKRHASAATRVWDEASFMAALASQGGPDQVHAAREILNWCTTRADDVRWGRGSAMGAFSPEFQLRGVLYKPFTVWTYASGPAVELQLEYRDGSAVFPTAEHRQKLLADLRAIAGVSIPEERSTKRPAIPLQLLVDENRRQQFFEAFESFLHNH